MTSTQTRYERENETLGPAAYYVTNTNKWVVSNVGLFTGRTKPAQTSYSDTISTNFTIFWARVFPNSSLVCVIVKILWLGAPK